MFFIYLDAEELCVSGAREKTNVWEIPQSSLLAPGSGTHVCYGPPPRPGHGQPGHIWASTSKYIRSWWCQSLSDMFWTVFWNTSQPYSLFIIFHSLDLLPGFEVEFSNVSAQPPLRATIRSIGPALPPQRAPWEMLRAFLEDSWEGPLVWLAEPLPSVLRLWRPSLPW